MRTRTDSKVILTFSIAILLCVLFTTPIMAQTSETLFAVRSDVDANAAMIGTLHTTIANVQAQLDTLHPTTTTGTTPTTGT